MIKLVTLVAGCGLIVMGAVGLADDYGRRWANVTAVVGGLCLLLLHVVIC